MKKVTVLVAALSCFWLAGCNGESGPSTNADISNSAAQLNKASEGVEPIPDPAVVDRSSGTGTGATAPKPGSKPGK